MSSLKIAVIGGGNGSYTAAADFALAGHTVRMYPGEKQKHFQLFRQGTIRLQGSGRTGEAKLNCISEEPGEVISGAEVIVSMDPAPSQAARALLMAPHVEDGQLLFLSPGSLGPLVFENVFRQAGRKVNLCYAEPGTLPYLTRKTEANQVQVSALAVHLPIGVFPACRTDAALELINRIYPAAHPVEDALSAALLNVGPIIHSVLFLLNTAAIEHFSSWDIHNEGTTPSVVRLILSHDAERIQLREALGYSSHHYPFQDHYHPCEEAVWMYGNKAHHQLVQSEKWRESLGLQHRYIQEDVKCNLVLMTSVGKLTQVDTPIADALLTLISSISDEDFRKTGRSLEALGLGHLTLNDLRRLLRDGG